VRPPLVVSVANCAVNLPFDESVSVPPVTVVHQPDEP